MPAVQIKMTVTGAKQGKFKGDGTSASPDQIACVGFSYEVKTPFDSATGHLSGKRQHEPVVITKEWTDSSPQFYAALFSNETLSTVVLDFIQTDKTGKDFVDHTITLTNALIVDVQQTVQLAAIGGPIVDARELNIVTFTFQKIEIEDKTGKTSASDDWSVTA